MRMRVTRILLALILASSLACGAQTRPSVVENAIGAAHAAMSTQLEKQYLRDKIVTRVEEGPFSTVIAVAAFPGAYPGTGVLRQMIDAASGVAYGGRAERTFADFARERGWLDKAPETDALLRTLNTALFEGVAMLDTSLPPKVTISSGALHIEVVQRYMPSHQGDWLIVTVPRQGKEAVVRRPLQK